MKNPVSSLGFLQLRLRFLWSRPPPIASLLSMCLPPSSVWLVPSSPEPHYIQAFGQRCKDWGRSEPRWLEKFLRLSRELTSTSHPHRESEREGKLHLVVFPCCLSLCCPFVLRELSSPLYRLRLVTGGLLLAVCLLLVGAGAASRPAAVSGTVRLRRVSLLPLRRRAQRQYFALQHRCSHSLWQQWSPQ